MPEISRFFGVVICMFWTDHNPPHFHAFYSGDEAQISLDGEVMRGRLPRRALSLVLEWLASRRHELADDWERARNRQPLLPIAPLE